MWWVGKGARGGRGKGEEGRGEGREGGERGGAYSFVACLSHLTIDHASLSRRSTGPTPNRHTSNIWALSTLFPCMGSGGGGIGREIAERREGLGS